MQQPSAAVTSPEFVCPEDADPLGYEDGALVCSANHRWAIKDGIPRFVPPQSYADAFGLQWKTFRRTQLDSFTKTTLSRDRAMRCLGSEVWQLLHDSKQCSVLEVGCGAGRFTEILLSTHACVTSVDLSSAVEANQENFPQDSRHRILQADVRRLPFAPGQFDVVFCLGVVQHTPDPEETIRKLYEHVKPGGWLVIDHYTPTLSEFTKSALLVRLFFRRVPPATSLRWTRTLVETLLPAHRVVRNRPIARTLLTRVSPILTYYHALPLCEDLQRDWSLLDTYDSLTDRYKHFRTKSQLARYLRSLGADVDFCAYGGNGVEARCRRPCGSSSPQRH
jgi:2-polyprenyl-3-methyl-5-hydroxy-6-metoxy-1,4-benzoquinol methylase